MLSKELLLVSLLVIPTSMDLSAPVAEAMGSSVYLRIKGYTKVGEKEVKGMGGCSGTYVSGRAILTAAHCVDRDVITVWARGPYDGKGYEVRIMAFDRTLDLALLEAPEAHSYVLLGPDPEIGAEVFSVGSPMGLKFLATNGIVAQKSFTMENKASHYIATTLIDNGSSGGGLFDSVGRLVGVNVRKTLFIGGIAIAVDRQTIDAFLSRSLPPQTN